MFNSDKLRRYILRTPRKYLWSVRIAVTMTAMSTLQCHKCGKTYVMHHAFVKHVEKCTKNTSPPALIRDDSISNELNTENDVVDNVEMEMYEMEEVEEARLFDFDELIGLNVSDVSTYAMYPTIPVEQSKPDESEEITELLNTAQDLTLKYLSQVAVTVAPSVRACPEAATFLEMNPETSIILSASQMIPVLPEKDWETVLNKSKDTNDDSVIEESTNLSFLLSRANKVIIVDKVKCDHCDNEFPTLEDLDKHNKMKHKINIFKCNQCDNEFLTLEDLDEHNKVKHKISIFKCVQCENEFLTLEDLDEHNKVKHKINIFKCDKCDYSSDTKENIVDHMLNTHEVNILEIPKKYLCTDCDFESDERERMKHHMKTEHIVNALEGEEFDIASLSKWTERVADMTQAKTAHPLPLQETPLPRAGWAPPWSTATPH